MKETVDPQIIEQLNAVAKKYDDDFESTTALGLPPGLRFCSNRRRFLLFAFLPEVWRKLGH